jgi:hypothetical protein
VSDQEVIVGTLFYGPTAKELPIDDRVLAHLQIVILTKLRRGESFSFQWEKPAQEGSGHSTIWMHPMIFLEFDFVGSRSIALNKAWVEELSLHANSGHGLILVPEPAAAAMTQPSRSHG